LSSHVGQRARLPALPAGTANSRAANSRTADSRTADSRAADSRAADSRTTDSRAACPHRLPAPPTPAPCAVAVPGGASFTPPTLRLT